MTWCASKNSGTRAGPTTSSAWSSARACISFTSSKKPRCAACLPSWRCCLTSNRPSTRRPSPAPRLPGCGSSCLPRAPISSCAKTPCAMTGATSSPPPTPRWTTCNSCTTNSATGTWPWPPTTGGRATWPTRWSATARRAWACATKTCACPTKPATTCPSCKPSKTSLPTPASSTPRCPTLATTPSSTPLPSPATSTWPWPPSWPACGWTICAPSTPA